MCCYGLVQRLGAEPGLESWCHWCLYNSVRTSYLTSLCLSLLTNTMGVIHNTFLIQLYYLNLYSTAELPTSPLVLFFPWHLSLINILPTAYYLSLSCIRRQSPREQGFLPATFTAACLVAWAMPGSLQVKRTLHPPWPPQRSSSSRALKPLNIKYPAFLLAPLVSANTHLPKLH